MDELFARDDFKRLSRHNEGMKASLMPNIMIKFYLVLALFQVWVPNLYAKYVELMKKLCTNDPRLKPNFEGTAFAASTLNFGPVTESLPHTDFNNLSYGLCTVTALGNFDPTRGGHLVLWDLNLVVEFPAGATILLPSAVLRHSNTAIQPGERRYSFTQYTSGGLFRWVEHGFRSVSKYMAGLSKIEKAEEERLAGERWNEGMHLYCTVDELKAMYAA